jgi:acyl carrier protein
MDDVLGVIIDEMVAVLGGAIPADDVSLDADVFDPTVELVAGRVLDSIDVVEIVAALEERFGVSLDDIGESVDTVTLRVIADHLSDVRPSSAPYAQ